MKTHSYVVAAWIAICIGLTLSISGCAESLQTSQSGATSPTRVSVTTTPEIRSPSPPSLPETSSPEMTPTPITNTWTDTFESSRNPIWSTGSAEGDYSYSAAYRDGKYQISIGSADTFFYSYNGRVRFVRDVQWEVDIDPITQEEPIWYGFLCRGQKRDNAYGLLISNTKQAKIVVFRPRDLVVFKIIEERDFSDLQLATNEPHRLGATCIDTQLTLFLNGEELLQATNSEFTTGWIGFLFYNQGREPSEIKLDNAQMTIFYPPKQEGINR